MDIFAKGMDKTAVVWYNEVNGGATMAIHDGNRRDLYDLAPERYLQINSCGFQNLKENYTVLRERGRRDYQLLLIESGVCEAELGGEKHLLSAGNILLYPPNVKQRYTFLETGLSLWCHFTGTVVEEVLSEYGLEGGVYRIAPDHALFEAYTALIRRFHQKTTRPLAIASLLEVLFDLSRVMNAKDAVEGQGVIDSLLNYMHMHYAERLSVEALARQTGYSESRISHLFTEVTGKSPMRYLNDIRLKASRELLLSTQLSVGEIAATCGFEDPLYYSRRFRKHYGMSPTEYRGS